MEVVEVNRENMCVILIDHGIVDDHLPNHVLSALKTCKTQHMHSPKTYNRQAIQELRENKERHLCEVQKMKLARENATDRKFFAGGTPMQELPGDVAGNVKRYHFKKQGGIDNGVPMSNLHPLAASGFGQDLEVPGHRSSALSRISECTDEDATSVQLEVGEITVRAEVVALDMEERTQNETDSDTQAKRSDSGTRQVNSTESETTFQFQDNGMCSQSSENSLALGCSIDSPLSSLPPTPATAGDEVFSTSPGGGRSRGLSCSSSRAGLRLQLHSAASSTDSVSSAGSNKLLARRNIKNEKLKLDITANT